MAISKERKEKWDSRVRDHAFSLTSVVGEYKELDPVAASKAVKETLQYLSEKLELKNKFTIKELEELGYL